MRPLIFERLGLFRSMTDELRNLEQTDFESFGYA